MTPANVYQDATRVLAERDPVLARVIRRVGSCQLRRSRNYFLTLLEAIVWQQLSWKAACSIYDRVLVVVGKRRPRPVDVLSVPVLELRQAGLSRQKCRYILELAEHFEARRFPPRNLSELTDDEVVEKLTSMRGLGRWSADMFLMFGLNRPDIFPIGDLGLRKTMARLYKIDAENDRKLLDVARRWRPYRTIGSWYVWAAGDDLPFEGESVD